MKESVLLFLILLLAIHTAGAKDPVRKTQANFIIFIADDVSWNDFGCYGNNDVKTPNIDQIAGRGLRFNNVYLTASSCSPSRNSIMAGRYPHNTGACELHTQPPADMPALSMELQKAGYWTASSGKFHMGDNVRSGFDSVYTRKDLVGDGGEDAWLKALKDRPEKQPFFLWLAAHDAHRNWGENSFSGIHGPEELSIPICLADSRDTRNDVAAYYDEIHRFDHHIGQVITELERQGELDNTLIIIMADNGRPFPGSKTRVNDRGMKTPFVLYWKGKIIEGTDCDALISTIDIAPTLLSLAGAKAPASFQGVGFEKLLTEPDSEFRNYVFAEHNWHDYEAHERMARSRRYLYILNSRPRKPASGPADAVGSPSYKDLLQYRDLGILNAVQADVFVLPRSAEELYDCVDDPFQLHNLAGDPAFSEALEEMRTLCHKQMEMTGDNIPQDLTPDYYLYEPGYIRTPEHGKRGEMPGAASGATRNDHPGHF